MGDASLLQRDSDPCIKVVQTDVHSNKDLMDLAINRTASGFVLAESAHGEAGPTYVTKLSAKLTC